MSNISKPQVNPVTGNVYVEFNAELLSVSDKVLETNTDKKTKFRPATVKFADTHGVVTQSGAIIWEGNFSKGMTVGTEYRCRAENTPRGVLITVSHLTGSAPADASAFGFDTITADQLKELNSVAN